MYRIGIDVGGTFTDVILVREATGDVHVAKVLNEPGRRAATVVRGIRRVMDLAGVQSKDVQFIGHGTTIATNAVIERKGAKTALIANKGFRDSLEIGRFARSAELIYAVQRDKPSPLVPRHLRFGADCRIDASGAVVRELADAEVERVVEEVRASGAEAVAISLLFSFLEPRHEQRLRDRLREALPQVDTLASSDVQPEFREYPRTSTTVFAAYVAPVMRQYLETLMAGMREAGIASPLFIFQSNGGVARPELVIRNPVTTLLSGPAGAVVGATRLSASGGYPRLITMDMGGTSLDVCLLRDGVAEATTAREIDSYPIVTPMLDVHTVGAGGGSIVRLDEVGRIKVGPDSAAADPGPACYGLGGSEVTLTDVNVVLGYVDPDNFAGGEVKLYPEKAREVIQSRIAGPLKVDVVAAAAGVFKVAASQMAEAIRFVSVQRGVDPREFDLCVFGGGGPIHAFAIADELGMRRIVVPGNPGLFSASGIAVADFTHDYSVSILKPAAGIDLERLEREYGALRRRAEADFDSEGVPRERRRYQKSADMRYIGQTSEINIRTTAGDSGGKLDLDAYLAAHLAEFHRQHEAVYTYSVPDEPVEIVNIRLRAIGLVDKPKQRTSAAGGAANPAGTREAWFGRPMQASVYARKDLAPGARIAGPAIIQELSSATIVPPGATATVDPHENILLEMP
ncbi:MAG: hydantoinase/oxoprolinase family protein [Betaproteobacteria bacterium]